MTPTKLEKQIDKAIGGWKTSSSQFNAVTGKIKTAGEFPHLISLPFDIIFNCTQRAIYFKAGKKAITSKIFSGWQAYGIPTIRSDLPAPTTRRVADTTVS